MGSDADLRVTMVGADLYLCFPFDPILSRRISLADRGTDIAGQEASSC